MKFAIFGTEREFGIPQNKLDRNNPDIAIVFGGDGTILRSEQRYPGIPKLTFRNSEHGTKCTYDEDQISEIIGSLICNEKYIIKEEVKLEAYYNGITLHALNETQIHNKSPQRAIRFVLSIDGVLSYHVSEIIGDGVIICTPFGSTGYYNSLTKKTAEGESIGVALSNPSNIYNDTYLMLADTHVISIDITRGDGWLLADNNDIMVPISAGAHITVKKSTQTAKFVTLDNTI